MQVIYKRCAGADVHKKTVVVCVLITREDGSVEKHLRTFSTMTADLLALDEWLRGLQVEHVVMESTGVFWHPVYNLLEEGRQILLVNPQHMRAVPGHKTDVKDAEWLADLHRHGLLKASFIPPQPIRELRELTRYRKTLVQERAQEINRLQKVLEGANIKSSLGGNRCLGQKRQADARCPGRGSAGCRGVSGASARTAAGEVTRVTSGLRGPRAAPSPLSAHAHFSAHRFLGGVLSASATGD